jgi:hypothetical protein
MKKVGVAAWLGAALLAALAAFFAGRSLAGGGESPSIEVTGPAYQAGVTIAGLSKGGFSGFTESGGDARTVLSGRVVAVAGDSITLESQAGVRSTIRLTDAARVTRLEPASAGALRAGLSVMVRRGPEGEAAAVLVLADP